MTYKQHTIHRAVSQSGAPVADGGGGVVAIPGEIAIPNLVFRVAANNHLRISDDHSTSKPGDYYDGDELVLEGPTAHHLELAGYGTIVREA